MLTLKVHIKTHLNDKIQADFARAGHNFSTIGNKIKQTW